MPRTAEPKPNEARFRSRNAVKEFSIPPSYEVACAVFTVKNMIRNFNENIMSAYFYAVPSIYE